MTRNKTDAGTKPETWGVMKQKREKNKKRSRNRSRN
jgi:hypothetical protein